MSSPKCPRSRLSLTQLEDRLVPAGGVTEQIIVDQIGWRTDATKIVIFANPQQGQNSANTYVPGATFQVRRASDGTVAFTGDVVQWNNGATDPVSGDKAWRGDFSSLTAPGDYYVFDPNQDLQSYTFHIGPDVYNGVLEAAGRMFYYQRSGTEIPAQFGGNWSHAVDHISERTALQIVGDTPQAGTERDVSGGWWDAGDYNKYVSFTQVPIWELLSAYEWNPSVFSDDWNTPESGNGVPDVLDQVRWEMDWLLKMQLDDGSVLNRVGQTSFDVAEPAADTQPHYYTGATTWATASFAASTAHAARVFATFDAAYADQLRQAAEKAWAYLNGHPNMEPANGLDGGNLAAADGSADKEGDGDAANDASADRRTRLLAAAELFRLTGDDAYKTYFDTNYKSPALAQANFQPMLNGLLDASLCLDLNQALVTYAQSPGATANVVTEIKAAVQGAVDNVLGNQNGDPYLAYMYDGHYTYGSNELKANWANLLAYGIVLDVGSDAQQAQSRQAGEEYLHYFHGRNPLSQTYLTNLGSRGANLGVEKSVMEAYHSWWLEGNPRFDGPNSQFGPAPGYVVGGANQFFTGDLVGPPRGEPPMKAYRDFNTTFNTMTGKDERAYEVNEAAIYSQSAYVLLASQFATAPTVQPPFNPSSFFAVGNEGGTIQLFATGQDTPFISFRPLDSGGTQYTGLVSVALGDVTGDGKQDLIVAPVSPLGDKGLAADKAGRLFVYDGSKLLAAANGGGDPNTALLYSRQPFGANYTNGLNIATGDVNGDGRVDIVVGSRGSSGGVGNPEQGRFVAIGAGEEFSPTAAQIGSSINAFGQGYQKGCVVTTADLDGDGRAEVIVTRGGPVAATNPNKDLKVKVFRLGAADFEEVGLTADGSPLAPFAGIQRGGRITATDTDGDGNAEFVVSVPDPTTGQIQTVVYAVDVVAQRATEVNRDAFDNDVADFAIAALLPDGAGNPRLAVAIDRGTAPDSLLFLNPLTGAFTIGIDENSPNPFTLTSGGVTLDGF